MKEDSRSYLQQILGCQKAEKKLQEWTAASKVGHNDLIDGEIVSKVPNHDENNIEEIKEEDILTDIVSHTDATYAF